MFTFHSNFTTCKSVWTSTVRHKAEKNHLLTRQMSRSEEKNTCRKIFNNILINDRIREYGCNSSKGDVIQDKPSVWWTSMCSPPGWEDLTVQRGSAQSCRRMVHGLHFLCRDKSQMDIRDHNHSESRSEIKVILYIYKMKRWEMYLFLMACDWSTNVYYI